MKNFLASVTLIAASASACAEWQRIDAPFADVDLYADHETVGKSGDRRVQIYHILDYKSLQQRNDREFRQCETLRIQFDLTKLKSSPGRALIRSNHTIGPYELPTSVRTRVNPMVAITSTSHGYANWSDECTGQ